MHWNAEVLLKQFPPFLHGAALHSLDVETKEYQSISGYIFVNEISYVTKIDRDRLQKNLLWSQRRIC